MTKPIRFNPAVLRSSRIEPGGMFAKIPEAHSLAEVMRPAYWANCHPILRPFMTITFVHELFEFEGELRVTRSNENDVRFYPIRIHEAAKAAPQPKDGVSIETGGPHGYRVMDQGKIASPDGKQLVKLGSRADAEEAAAAYREFIKG